MGKRISVYLADDVYAQSRGLNISRLCTEAVKAEIDRLSQIKYGPARSALQPHGRRTMTGINRGRLRETADPPITQEE